MDACVVGAGIIGAATSYCLAKRGVRVTVFDSTTEPAGASGATFAWVNANGKEPDHYFELNRAAMAANDDLARELGDGSWLHGGGSLEWAIDPEGSAALTRRVAHEAARGYPAQLVDAARVRELEPSLSFESAPVTAAWFNAESWIDARALIELLLKAAAANGASIRRGVSVTSVGAGPSGGAELIVDGGERLHADLTFNCAGADAGVIAGQAGWLLDTAGAPGLNVVSGPLPGALRRIVRAPGVHFRPETGDRVLMASPAADKALAQGTSASALAPNVVAACGRYLPQVLGAPIDEVRVGRRSVPPDGLPIVGRTDDAPWLYHLVTHSGVTLAPLLSRLAAAEILDGRDEPSLAPYRPQRFLVG